MSVVADCGSVFGNHVSLFSGIGGFDLGLERVGVGTVLAVEKDAHARRVLGARFPDAELAEDVCELGSLPGDVGVVSAGFPCQDVSTLNFGRAGLSGDRSGLVFEVLRLLDSSPWVGFVFLENVSNFVRVGKGSHMRLVIRELESLGFRCAWRLLDGGAFGVPQRRRRWFLVGCRDGSVDPDKILCFGPEFAGFPPGRFLGLYPHLVVEMRWNRLPTLNTMPGGLLVYDFELDSLSGLPDNLLDVVAGFPEGWTGGFGFGHSRRGAMVGNSVIPGAVSWLASQVVSDEDAVLSPESDTPPVPFWNWGRLDMLESLGFREPQNARVVKLREALSGVRKIVGDTVPLSALRGVA